MSNSPLVEYTQISPNKILRASKIDRITPHIMGVDHSIEVLGAYFQSRASKASSNYGIDSKGRVAMYVPENWRSQCSDEWENDERAITVEIANDGPGPDYHVSDAAIEKFIELCIDVCKRYEIPKLIFTGDESGNVTLHKWYAAKPCPGPYLESKIPYIVEQVNKRLPISKAKRDIVKEAKLKNRVKHSKDGPVPVCMDE